MCRRRAGPFVQGLQQRVQLPPPTVGRRLPARAATAGHHRWTEMLTLPSAPGQLPPWQAQPLATRVLHIFASLW
jgi:hypothetical protein